jgi:hypothetical protein
MLTSPFITATYSKDSRSIILTDKMSCLTNDAGKLAVTYFVFLSNNKNEDLTSFPLRLAAADEVFL